MKASEIKEMTNDEVADALEEKKANLVKLRMQHTVSPLENPNVLAEARKDIARLNTEARSRQIAAAKAEA